MPLQVSVVPYELKNVQISQYIDYRSKMDPNVLKLLDEYPELEKISKYMDTIQTEIDKFSKSEQALKQDVLKAKNTNFWLKILLVTVVVGMGLVFTIVN